jgi:hypothetical protein
MVSLVAPPIATARYLRALYGDTPLDITYVGNCPSANSDPSIARQIRPEDFFASLTARGIVAAREPLVFNSFFAPDRRRSVSLPGGLPIDRILQEPPGTGDVEGPEKNGSSSLPLVPRSVVSIRDVEYAAELAQYLIMAEPVLLDVAPRLGCACSGAVSGVAVADARAAVMALEPPRSPGPVVDSSIDLELDLKPRVEELADRPPASARPPIPEIDLDDFWPAEPVIPGQAADAQNSPRTSAQTSAKASAQASAKPSAQAEVTASATWMASSALAGSDQLLTRVTSPGSSRSTTAADRGAGVP